LFRADSNQLSASKNAAFFLIVSLLKVFVFAQR